MTNLVASVSIQSVDDLYRQYGRLAKTYSQDDNPLAGLTHIIPKSAEYFVVVPRESEKMATDLMDRVRGRKKLKKTVSPANEIRYAPFARSNEIVVIYA